METLQHQRHKSDNGLTAARTVGVHGCRSNQSINVADNLIGSDKS